jgi:hypothetical protein
MADKPESLFRLNPTRFVLIAMLAAALTLSVSTITASLNEWREQDAAAATQQAGN